MLSLRRAVAGYGAVEALRGVNFNLHPQRWLALLGPVGAGKTTLLAVLAGLLPLTRGDVLLDNASIAHLPADKRLRAGIALVPEGRRLFSGMSVRENLMVGAHAVRSRERIEARLQQVMELFPVLSARFRQIAGTLSGGEQQMCAIGRALMAEPRILLIDEVSLGLAPQVVERLFAALAEIARQGTTLVTVEQNVGLALESSDRACILRNGIVVAEGESREIRATVNVARLTGAN